MHLRQALTRFLAAMALATTLLPGPTAAAGYPERAVTIIVPATAGGPSDIIARVMAEGLSRRFAQPVVVVNRPGANTAIGFNSFVRSAPDGYTLYHMTALTSSLPLMQQNFEGNPVDAVEAISLLATNAIAVVARGTVPFNTLPEALGYARANPGKLTVATLGGLPELLARYIFQTQNANVTYVPYKGAADIATALVGQQVDLSFFSLVGVGAFLADGRLKVLATTGKARSPARPNVATIAETIPGLEVEDINYFGLVAPKGTPQDVLATLHAAVVEVGRTEEFRARIRGLESTPMTSSREEFRAIMNTIGNWRRMAREVGFAPK